MREKEKKIKKKIVKERARGRAARFKEPTVVKEPSSSLHLDTHKYKTQRFELTKKERSMFSLFSIAFLLSLSLSLFLLLPSRLSSHIGAANLFHVPAFSGPFTIFGHAVASSTSGYRSLEDTALSHP